MSQYQDEKLEFLVKNISPTAYTINTKKLIKDANTKGIKLEINDISSALTHDKFQNHSDIYEIELNWCDKDNIAEYTKFILSISENKANLPCKIEKISFSQARELNHEIKLLSITTGIQIGEPKEYGANDLSIKIWQGFYQKLIDTPNLDKDKLLEIIKENAKLHQTGLSETLKILSQVNWDEISTFSKFPNLNQNINDIRREQKLEGEIYAKKIDDNHYFYMEKINSINFPEWQKLGRKSNAIDGFIGALQYYDNSETEVWVGYIATKPIEGYNYTAFVNNDSSMHRDSIGMYVTATTSSHSPCTNHLGITKINESCKGYSSTLHSLITQVMLERYPDKKYMINVPLANMREIMSAAFEKAGIENATNLWYEGIEKNEYQLHLEEEKLNQRIALKHDQKDVTDAKLLLNYLKQETAIKDGKTNQPIIYDKENDSFIFVDRTGRELCRVNKEAQQEEFAWLFRGWQLNNAKRDLPAVITSLPELANLQPVKGKFEHHELPNITVGYYEANKHIIDEFGKAHIHNAITPENRESVDFLVKHGTQVPVKNDNELTAIDHTKKPTKFRDFVRKKILPSIQQKSPNRLPHAEALKTSRAKSLNPDVNSEIRTDKFS
jgi:hypothetical protein